MGISIDWAWIETQYMSGLKPVQIAELYLATFGRKVSKDTIGVRASHQQWLSKRKDLSQNLIRDNQHPVITLPNGLVVRDSVSTQALAQAETERYRLANYRIQEATDRHIREAREMQRIALALAARLAPMIANAVKPGEIKDLGTGLEKAGRTFGTGVDIERRALGMRDDAPSDKSHGVSKVEININSRLGTDTLVKEF